MHLHNVDFESPRFAELFFIDGCQGKELRLLEGCPALDHLIHTHPEIELK